MPEIQNFCKRISLFDNKTSFSQYTQESFSSFKEQSIAIEDSTTIGEITPVKDEDSMKKTFPEESFSSPLATIQIFSPPETVFVITPELSDKKKTRKGGLEFNTPESHFFSLSSSSSQDLVSEVSFSEEVPPSFGDISSMHRKPLRSNNIDREIQTDDEYKEIISLLHDHNIINGLKMIGKFSELMKLINK